MAWGALLPAAASARARGQGTVQGMSTSTGRSADDQEQQPATEFFTSGYRWFDLDLTLAPYAHDPSCVIVAMASIDLAEAGMLTEDQLEYDPNPVTRMALCREADGRLSSFTSGDCEYYGSRGPVLVKLGALALAAGSITDAQWQRFVERGLA